MRMRIRTSSAAATTATAGKVGSSGLCGIACVVWALAIPGAGMASAGWTQVAGGLAVPEGFEAQLFAEGLAGPRGLAFGPDGGLYAALSGDGRVVVLPDRNGDGQADAVTTVIEGLNRPSGIAWRGDDLWVAEMTRVIRLEGPIVSYPRSDYAIVVRELPAGGHWTRTLLMDPSGSGFFLAIGSSCDVCREDDPRRGAIVRYNLDGSGESIWASGLRNAVGLAFSPETGELWATDSGRDWLGDDLPPDELNAVRPGGDYGWPYCYGARVANPEFADTSRCDGTEPPIMTFPAHSAPTGIAFYTGDQFPPEFRGDAFVALHGSWNRSVPAGYKVVRVRIAAGRPEALEVFASGWLATGGRIGGRPVQPLVGPDGALYVSDDSGGRVWRIAYAGEGFIIER